MPENKSEKSTLESKVQYHDLNRDARNRIRVGAGGVLGAMVGSFGGVALGGFESSTVIGGVLIGAAVGIVGGALIIRSERREGR